MTKKSDLPPAPSHLRPETARWWLAIVDDYDLEVSDLRVLEAAVRPLGSGGCGERKHRANQKPACW